jgi:molybdate transport system regulatory protein
MRPRFNLWIEKDGEVTLSIWRVQMLEAIARTGSITGAAEALDVPYRRVWERLNECEERLGVQLVARHAGGEGGGGAHLTEAGQDYVARFRRMSEGLEDLIRERFGQAFGDMA